MNGQGNLAGSAVGWYGGDMADPVTTSTTPAAETVVPVLGEYIVKTPGTCGGKPRIAGTRIKVQHVYVWVEKMGMTPAEVVATYPHLTMAGVHAALAYYWSHRDEIHREMEEDERFVEELKAKAGPSPLQRKLAEMGHAPGDPLPPG
jgi:uncharacterized protein (DUF433 family)